MKRPAFQFYPADWRKDAALQSCSIAARGLWHELLCVMHECEPYGHLVVNEQPMADAQAARLCGVDGREYRRLMGELNAAGVPSRTAAGAIYSRRMVRDERIRSVRAEAGKLGGNPDLLGRKVNQNPTLQVTDKDNLEPTPSSSSSSSTSVECSNSGEAVDKSPSHPGSQSDRIQPRPGQWWKTNDGIEAEAKAEGVKPLPGEGYPELKARVFEAKAAKKKLRAA